MTPTLRALLPSLSLCILAGPIGCEKPQPLRGPPRPENENLYEDVALRAQVRSGVDVDAELGKARSHWRAGDPAMAMAVAVRGLEAGRPSAELAGLAAAGWGAWRARVVSEIGAHPDCGPSDATPDATAWPTPEGGVACGVAGAVVALGPDGTWAPSKSLAPPTQEAGGVRSPDGRCVLGLGAPVQLRCDGAPASDPFGGRVQVPPRLAAVADDGQVALVPEHEVQSLAWVDAAGRATVGPRGDYSALWFDGDALVAVFNAPDGTRWIRRLTRGAPTGAWLAEGLAPGAAHRVSGRVAQVRADGQWALASADRRRRIASGSLSLAGNPAIAARMSGDGSHLAVLDASGALHLVEVKGRTARRVATGVPGAAALAWAPDGQRLAVVGQDGATAVVSVVGTALRSLQLDLPGRPDGAVWDPRDRLWASSGGRLAAIHAVRGEAVAGPELPAGAARIRLSASADRALVSSEDGALRLLPLTTEGGAGWTSAERVEPASVTALAFDEDPDRAWVGGADGRVALVEGATGEALLRTPPLGAPVVELIRGGDGVVTAFLEDGRAAPLYAPLLSLPPEQLFARLVFDAAARADGAPTRWRSPQAAIQ